jgi:ABC-type nitrate/sulfonate/bicarbonate transport system ATPase subunit
VLDCASAVFVSGEFVAVLSKSGGGKSTVLNLIRRDQIRVKKCKP